MIPSMLTLKMMMFVGGLVVALVAIIALNRWFQTLRWGRSGQRRILAQDVHVLDDKNRLHLVQVDKQEFLILTGQQSSQILPINVPAREEPKTERRSPFLREVSGE